MWHIGVRDEARRLDGIGRCGRQFCSASWLPELRPVKSSTAKDQRLSTLNPAQISGTCGRLMCCLRHEHEFYVQQRKRFPKEGKIVTTAVGEEKIVSNDIFRDLVTLRTAEGEYRTIPLADLRKETAPGVVPPDTGPAAGSLVELKRAANDDAHEDDSHEHEHDDEHVEEEHHSTRHQAHHPTPHDDTDAIDEDDSGPSTEPGSAPSAEPRSGPSGEPRSGASAAPTGPESAADAERRKRRRRGRRGGRRGRGDAGGNGSGGSSTPPSES
jgi:hypothetical protein